MTAAIGDLDVGQQAMDRLALPGLVNDLLVQELAAPLAQCLNDSHALVGSANVTSSALGFTVPGNRELLVDLDPVPISVLSFVRALVREASPPTDALRSGCRSAGC